MLQPSTPTADWVLHEAAAGISVRKPADWCVQAQSGGGIVISAPRGAAAALVRLRAVPARTDLAQWLRREYVATEPGLHNVRMLRSERHGAHVAQATFDYGSTVFPGRARAIAVRRGDIATLFVAAAARAEFAQRLPELTRILDSLRFCVGAGRAGADRASAAGSGRSYEPAHELDLARLLKIGTAMADR